MVTTTTKAAVMRVVAALSQRGTIDVKRGDGPFVDVYLNGVSVLEEIPIKYQREDALLTERIFSAEFQCKECGHVGSGRHVCGAKWNDGSEKSGWKLKISEMDPQAFMAFYLEEKNDNGSRKLDVVMATLTPSKRRSQAIATKQASIVLRRYLREAFSQLLTPLGGGARALSQQGVEIGKVRVFLKTPWAPWMNLKDLHPAEATIETRKIVAKELMKKGISVTATSGSRPGLTFYVAGDIAPNFMQQCYPGLRYNALKRHSTMSTSALQAVELLENEPAIVKVKDGAVLPGRNLLTVMMPVDQGVCDLVPVRQEAIEKFAFVHEERVAVPKGSVLNIVDGETLLVHRHKVAKTASGRNLWYESFEFGLGVEHHISTEIECSLNDKGERVTEADGVVLIRTPRVAGEASKLTQNGNKGSAVILEEDYVIAFNGQLWDVEAILSDSRMRKGDCWASPYEGLASRVAKFDGADCLEVSEADTWEALKDRISVAIATQETFATEEEEMLHDWAKEALAGSKDAMECVSRVPVYKKANMEFVGFWNAGWLRWQLQPQHPEVVSSVSSREMPDCAINDDGTLKKQVNHGSHGAKILGWELDVIQAQDERLAEHFKSYANEGTNLLIAMMAEVLTFSPKHVLDTSNFSGTFEWDNYEFGENDEEDSMEDTGDE